MPMPMPPLAESQSQSIKRPYNKFSLVQKKNIAIHASTRGIWKVSQELNITYSCVYKWVQQHKNGEFDTFTKSQMIKLTKMPPGHKTAFESIRQLDASASVAQDLKKKIDTLKKKSRGLLPELERTLYACVLYYNKMGWPVTANYLQRVMRILLENADQATRDLAAARNFTVSKSWVFLFMNRFDLSYRKVTTTHAAQLFKDTCSVNNAGADVLLPSLPNDAELDRILDLIDSKMSINAHDSLSTARSLCSNALISYNPEDFFIHQNPRNMNEQPSNFYEFTDRHAMQDGQLILNMDETPCWFDMPMSSTIAPKGTGQVFLQTTGGEHTRFTAVLTCGPDGLLIVHI